MAPRSTSRPGSRATRTTSPPRCWAGSRSRRRTPATWPSRVSTWTAASARCCSCPPTRWRPQLPARLLPEVVRHADAAANSGRTALLVAAMVGAPDLLMAATGDLLHQEYRRPAMPATLELVASLRGDRIAAVVSGAGPTVLALVPATDVEDTARRTPPGWVEPHARGRGRGRAGFFRVDDCAARSGATVATRHAGRPYGQPRPPSGALFLTQPSSPVPASPRQIPGRRAGTQHHTPPDAQAPRPTHGEGTPT